MKNKEIMSLVSVLLAAVALLLWFLLPALSFTVLGFTQNFSFLDATFGKSVTMAGTTNKMFAFSIVNFLGLLSIIGTLVLTILSTFVSKFKKQGVLFNYIAFGLSVLGAVIVFLVKNALNLDGSGGTEYLKVEVGPILVGILLIINAGILIFPKLLEKSKK